MAKKSTKQKQQEESILQIGGNASAALRSYKERIEKLEEEKAGLAADIRDVYAEAKGNGFDTKVLRQVIKRAQMEAAERQEADAILNAYERALGMLGEMME